MSCLGNGGEDRRECSNFQAPGQIASNMAEGTSTKLESVADVEIDATGRFKYILIKVIDESGGGVYKYVVRGFDWADYHGKFCNSSATVGKNGPGKFWFFGGFEAVCGVLECNSSDV